MSQNKEWKETSWQDADDSNANITISEVLDILKDEPIVLVKLKDLCHIRDLSLCDHRVAEANLSYPIIVTEKEGSYTRILDGHHRRAKAVMLGQQNICAKILRFSCIPVQFQWLTN